MWHVADINHNFVCDCTTEVRTEGSKGKCMCFTPNPFSITGKFVMWHVSGFVRWRRLSHGDAGLQMSTDSTVREYNPRIHGDRQIVVAEWEDARSVFLVYFDVRRPISVNCIMANQLIFYTEQRIFICDQYLLTQSASQVRRLFETRFPAIKMPSRSTVHNLYNKFQATGSVDRQKQHKPRSVLKKKHWTTSVIDWNNLLQNHLDAFHNK